MLGGVVKVLCSVRVWSVAVLSNTTLHSSGSSDFNAKLQYNESLALVGFVFIFMMICVLSISGSVTSVSRSCIV